MQLWARIVIGVVAAGTLAPLTVLLLVVIVDDGRGLGEPMWEGFVIQLMFMFLLSVIALAVFLAPTMLITERLIGIHKNTFAIYAIATIVALFIAFVYIGTDKLWALIPGTAGVVGLGLSEYLARRSTR